MAVKLILKEIKFKKQMIKNIIVEIKLDISRETDLKSISKIQTEMRIDR